MATALTELDTDEVSYVDTAAVNRRFAVLKRETMGEQNLHAVLDAPLGDLEERFETIVRKQQLDPAAKEALKGILKLMTAYGNNLKDEHLAPIAQLAGFAGNNFGAAASDDAEDEGEADGDESGEADDENEEGDVNNDAIEEAIKAAPPGQPPPKGKAPPPQDTKTGDDLTGDKKEEKPAPLPKPGQKAPPPARTPMKKADSTDETVRERITKAEQRAAVLEKELRSEVRKRQEREFVEKAQREFSKIGPAEQVGAMLLKLNDKGALADMEPMLRAMNEQAKTSDIFKTAGFDGRGDGKASPEQELDREAAEIRKREPGLTFEQAYDKAYTSRTDVRKRMRDAELGR